MKQILVVTCLLLCTLTGIAQIKKELPTKGKPPDKRIECLWKTLMLENMRFGLDLQDYDPRIKPKDFESQMMERLEKSKTQHQKSCKTKVHSLAVVVEITECPSSVLPENSSPMLCMSYLAARKEFLTPRSLYWIRLADSLHD